MSDLSWLPVATGIIGTITGVTGAVFGIKGFRRASQMKLLDLRVDLRKCAADLEEVVRGLPAKITHGHESRVAVSSAMGTSLSGAMEVWKGQVEADQAAVRALRQKVSAPPDDYRSLTDQEIEDLLIEVHRLTTTANQLVEKYSAAYAEDERDREWIRDAAHRRIEARTHPRNTL